MRPKDHDARRYHNRGYRSPGLSQTFSTDEESEIDNRRDQHCQSLSTDGSEIDDSGMATAFSSFVGTVSEMGTQISTELEKNLLGINIDPTKFNCTDVARAKGFSCGEAPVPQDFSLKLDWRQNPRISLSDWTLVVYDGTQSAVYNIHKSECRKSGFLSRQFDKDEREEETDPTTEVYLPPRAARLFPEFLDYVYNDEVEITTKDALAFKHLANHFDVRPLFKKVERYIETDLSIKTAPVYCGEADLVKDEVVQRATIELMARGFGSMDMTVVSQLPPKMFQDVLSSPHLDVESEFLSAKVAHFMRHCGSDTSDEMLFMLTHPQIMPLVSPNEAFYFLTQGIKYPQILNEGGDASLKSRCIAAITSTWSSTLVGAISTLKQDVGSHGNHQVNPDCAFNYNSLPAEVKVEIFEAAILAAKRDADKSSSLRHF